MLVKYKLYNLKERNIASLNKVVYEARAEDFNGKIYDKVSLWKGDWPTLTTETVEVMAEIKFTEKNGFKNVTLYPERTEGWGGGKKQPSVNMNKIMEKKQEGISASQDRKENSIKLAATMRDATLLTLEWIKQENLVMPPTEAEIKAKWTEWRKWLDQNFGDGVPF